MNAWWSLYMHGCPTMRAALATASSRQTSHVALWVGGGAVQAVRRLVSDGCGDMAMNLHDAVESGNVAEARRMVAAGADVEEQRGSLERGRSTWLQDTVTWM